MRQNYKLILFHKTKYLNNCYFCKIKIDKPIRIIMALELSIQVLLSCMRRGLIKEKAS